MIYLSVHFNNRSFAYFRLDSKIKRVFLMFLWELLPLNAANSVNFKIQRYIIFILCIKFKCCNISDLYIYNEILVHTTFIIIMSFLWQYYAVFKICVLLINLHIFSIIIDCFQKVTHHEIVKINI